MVQISSDLGRLLVVVAVCWAAGFAAVQLLVRRPALQHSLADVQGQMWVQLIVTTTLTIFVQAPLVVRLSVFGIFAARLLFEVAAIQPRHITGKSVALVVLMPVIPLGLFLAAMILATPFILLLAFFLSELFDSMSLLCGKVIGKHSFAQNISPQKTLEGFAGGAISVLLVCVYLWAEGLVTLERAAVSWPAIVIAATAGDLLASWVKRFAGVKDFPILLANQGGLLDMFDSWLLAAPMLASVFWLV